MPKRRLLDIHEASEELGVSVNTLYSWICMRKIEYIKVGRLVKFRQQTLDDFLERNTILPRNPAA